MASSLSMTDALALLTPGFSGQLIGRDAGEYEEARRIHNGMVDRRPLLIARCRSSQDVARPIQNMPPLRLPRPADGRLLLYAAAAAVLAAGCGAGEPAREAAPSALETRAASDVAVAAFREAIFETQNVGGAARIRPAIDRAVAADPSFALARIYQALTGPGSEEARAETITQELPSLAAAPLPDRLLALYWREAAAGRAADAVPVLEALAHLVPGDADIVWAFVDARRAGQPAAAQVEQVREFLRRFPDHVAARNRVAYALQAAGQPEAALQEVATAVRLAPDHPNAHDSFAELLMAQGRPVEAQEHARHIIQTDSLYQAAAGYRRLGVAQLLAGDAEEARASFARGVALAPAARFDYGHWTAASYAYTGDGVAALRELHRLLALAQTENNAVQAATAHERIAAIEAYLGDAVAAHAHLSAAAADAPPSAHYALQVIVYARIGDLTRARDAAALYDAMVPATNRTRHGLHALIALRAGDLPAAERALAQAPPDAPFTLAARAELLGRTGRQADAEPLKQRVMRGRLNATAAQGLDFFNLLAKLHVDQL